MTENKIIETVKTVVTHPIYVEFTNGEILKLAQKKLQLSHIAKVNGLKLENIFRKLEHEFWLAHIDLILKHHRSQHADTYLPNPLPSGVRQTTATMLANKHSKKVDEHFQKLKTKHVKLESKVKSSVRRRV